MMLLVLSVKDGYEDVEFVWPTSNFHTLVGASYR